MDRFWVGNGGIWNSTATDHWATASGGAPGASVPTGNDDVYFDVNSFTLDNPVISFPTVVDSKSVDFTGALHTPALVSTDETSMLRIFDGDLTFIAGMVVDPDITFAGVTTFGITSAGHVLGGLWYVTAIYDALQCDTLSCKAGFLTNDYDIIARLLYPAGSFGASTVTVTEMFIVSQGTINWGTATLNLPSISGGGYISIQGNFTNSPVFTGDNWNIICPDGLISAAHLTLVNSHASGGAFFAALDTESPYNLTYGFCVDGGGNTGWWFQWPGDWPPERTTAPDGLVLRVRNYVQENGVIYKSPVTQVVCKKN